MPCSSSAAMLTAHCGMPKRKFTVPSSGSTIQRTPLVPSRSPPSSPSTPSSGRAAAIRSRIRCSASWSASADQVGRRALGGDPQLRPVERIAQQRARLAGDRLGQRAQLAGRHAATAGRCAGHAAGLLELRRERDQPRLGVGRADELDAEREAVAGEAGGHGHRGLAGVVEGAGVRRQADHPDEGTDPAAPVELAHPRRPAGEHRRQHHVSVLEDRGSAARRRPRPPLRRRRRRAPGSLAPIRASPRARRESRSR